MSTYLHLACLDHDPPLLAAEESGQHLYDLPRIRAEVANRDRIVAALDDYTQLGYFEGNSARFFSQHRTCRVGIVDEYGQEHAVAAHAPTGDAPTPDVGTGEGAGDSGRETGACEHVWIEETTHADRAAGFTEVLDALADDLGDGVDLLDADRAGVAVARGVLGVGAVSEFWTPPRFVQAPPTNHTTAFAKGPTMTNLNERIAGVLALLADLLQADLDGPERREVTEALGVVSGLDKLGVAPSERANVLALAARVAAHGIDSQALDEMIRERYRKAAEDERRRTAPTPQPHETAPPAGWGGSIGSRVNRLAAVVRESGITVAEYAAGGQVLAGYGTPESPAGCAHRWMDLCRISDPPDMERMQCTRCGLTTEDER